MAPPGGSQTGHPKARAWSSGWSRQVGDLAGLPPLREAEVCESTGHKNAQPTRPERNAQPADLHRPSKDDPQQMYYRHDERQRGGDHHIGFSVQSACPSASRPTTLTIAYGYELFDASLPSGLARWRGHRRPSASPLALPSMHADWSGQPVWISTGLPYPMSHSARL